MKKINLFLMLVLTCVYSIAFSWTAADVSAGTISGTISGACQEVVYMLLYRNSCGSSTLEDFVITAADGSYSFTGLSNGSYKVKPLKTGYTFSPEQQSVTISNNSVSGVNFTAAAGRFTDNCDGTVTDTLTNLFWLKNANCFGAKNWDTAISWTAEINSGECGLTDGSAAGIWRLPSKEELQDIGTELSCGEDTWTMPSALLPICSLHLLVGYYIQTDSAWFVTMTTGGTYYSDISTSYYVWPVRSDLWAECAPGCYDIWIGDGLCDDACNVDACSYDEGDCEGEVWCATECPDDWIGDGWCDAECYFDACSYDEGDCIGWCAPGCLMLDRKWLL